MLFENINDLITREDLEDQFLKIVELHPCGVYLGHEKIEGIKKRIYHRNIHCLVVISKEEGDENAIYNELIEIKERLKGIYSFNMEINTINYFETKEKIKKKMSIVNYMENGIPRWLFDLYNETLIKKYCL